MFSLWRSAERAVVGYHLVIKVETKEKEEKQEETCRADRSMPEMRHAQTQSIAVPIHIILHPLNNEKNELETPQLPSTIFGILPRSLMRDYARRQKGPKRLWKESPLPPKQAV